MALNEDELVAAVATVTRRRFGTILQILAQLHRGDDRSVDLDEATLTVALDNLVGCGRLSRARDGLYTLPRP
jgi:hypothetical protein